MSVLTSIWRRIASIHLLGWIVIWTVIGVLLGLYAQDFSKDYMGLLSSHIFLPMVKSIIVPLVFSTLVVGIAGHGDDMVKLGRLAVRSLAYFMTLSVIAVFIGLGFANLIRPGDGVSLSSGSEWVPGKAEPLTLAGQLHHTIPTSFFKAASENATLQIVVCATFFSFGILLLKNQSQKQTMLAFMESLSNIMFKITEVVMRFVPLAIGGALAHTIAENGIGVLLNLGKLVVCVYAGLITFILLLCVIAVIMKVPVIKFMKTIWEPVCIAFATASSDAALPLAMEKLIQFGVPPSIVAFTIPVGYTFNLDGTTLYLSAAALFSMQAGNVEKTISEQIIMVFVMMISAKGVAGVPRASLLILSAASAQFGLPPAAVGIILTVDEIMDMGRTAVNLIGNCLCSVLIAKWEGEWPPVDLAELEDGLKKKPEDVATNDKKTSEDNESKKTTQPTSVHL